MAKRLALIDADEIAYKGAFACQDSYYVVKDGDKVLWKAKNKQMAIESIENADLDIDKEIVTKDLQLGYDRIDSIISRTVSASGSDDFRLFISGDNNFRKEYATLLPYKGNRKEKPINIGKMMEYIKYKAAESVDYLEADDLLSSYQGNVEGWETIICTQDKDLRTVPGLNYNPNTDKVTTISYMEARANFYYQLLIGDPVDNIPHPTGLGPKYAQVIIDSLVDEEDERVWYETVRQAYEVHLYKHKMVPADDSDDPDEIIWKTKWYDGRSTDIVLLEVGNLLHMHRSTDIDHRWEIPSGKKES